MVANRRGATFNIAWGDVEQMEEEQLYTLMVIPHANSPTLSLQFPLKWVKAAGLILSVIACFGLVFAFNYQQARIAAEELKLLTCEFQEQQQQILLIAQQAEELENDIAAIRELDETVRDMMNLSSPKKNEQPVRAASGEIAGSRSTTPSRGGLAATMLRTEMGLQSVRESIPESKNALQSLTKDIASQQAKERATPSIWPTSGKITSSYGYRNSPFGYGRQFHSGIDIGAKRGVPIYATADGTVRFSGYKSGYGYVVHISHGYGYTTVYAHMSKTAARNGQSVQRGHVIGYVGSSGRTTGPHLHYEVRVDGDTVNPWPYMNR